MKNRDTIIITLGITAITAGLAVIIFWDNKDKWSIVPIVLGVVALLSELMFYMVSFTQRDSVKEKAPAKEQKNNP